MASGVSKSGTSNGYPVKAQLQITGMCLIVIVVSESPSLSRHTRNKQDRATVNVIRDTCAFTAVKISVVNCIGHYVDVWWGSSVAASLKK